MGKISSATIYVEIGSGSAAPGVSAEADERIGESAGAGIDSYRIPVASSPGCRAIATCIIARGVIIQGGEIKEDMEEIPVPSAFRLPPETVRFAAAPSNLTTAPELMVSVIPEGTDTALLCEMT
jgi:hypothetical protein